MEESSTLMIVLGLCLVLGIACAIFLFSKRISAIPYTVLLTLTGMGFAYLNPAFIEAIKLNPESLFLIFLPILLFESAFNFDFREFRRIMMPGFLLASFGLIISAAIIALPLYYFFNIPFAVAFMFGSVISSTDPIAVLSLFKQLGVPKRLQLLVDGESFLNDATSVIMYKITLGFATGVVQSLNFESFLSGIVNFVYVFVGGILIGAVFGYLFSEIIARIENVHAVEITLTILLAHIVFIVGEEFLGVSGIVSVLAAGLILGNYGRTKISPEVTHTMHQTWELLVFVTTSIIFFLIGYEIHPQTMLDHLAITTVAIIALLVARSISIYSILVPYNKFVPVNSQIPASWMHITNWGGLRGALPLVVILSLPEDFVYKDILTTLVLGIVFFTLIINATTIKYLLKFFGLDKINQTNEIEVKITELLILRKLSKKLHKLYQIHEISKDIFDEKMKFVNKQIEENKAILHTWFTQKPEEYKNELEKILRRYCLQVEKSVYYSLFAKGIIPEIVYGALRNSIDLQIERLNENKPQIDVESSQDKMTGSYTLRLGWFDQLILLLDQNVDLEQKIIAYNYKYHKSRLLGDEQVLKEIDEFIGIDCLPTGIVHKIKLLYKELEEHNIATLKELEIQYPETTKRIELKFAELETKHLIKHVLHQFVEEERISIKSVQWLNAQAENGSRMYTKPAGSLSMAHY